MTHRFRNRDFYDGVVKNQILQTQIFFLSRRNGDTDFLNGFRELVTRATSETNRPRWIGRVQRICYFSISSLPGKTLLSKRHSIGARIHSCFLLETFFFPTKAKINKILRLIPYTAYAHNIVVPTCIYNTSCTQI